MNNIKLPRPNVLIGNPTHDVKTPPAGGIVPYVKNTTNNEVSFLFGREKSNKKWSGFVGGFEDSDVTIVNTAIREFNEETSRLFEKDLDIVRHKIITGDAFLILDKNINRLIYIWFIKFDHQDHSIPTKFVNQLQLMNDVHFTEKLALKWFTLPEIRNDKNDILYKLKKTILENYKKMP
jgi:ADP-ribose pyrophosphatase YjhB (NUDIX family)